MMFDSDPARAFVYRLNATGAEIPEEWKEQCDLIMKAEAAAEAIINGAVSPDSDENDENYDSSEKNDIIESSESSTESIQNMNTLESDEVSPIIESDIKSEEQSENTQENTENSANLEESAQNSEEIVQDEVITEKKEITVEELRDILTKAGVKFSFNQKIEVLIQKAQDNNLL